MRENWYSARARDIAMADIDDQPMNIGLFLEEFKRGLNLGFVEDATLVSMFVRFDVIRGGNGLSYLIRRWNERDEIPCVDVIYSGEIENPDEQLYREARKSGIKISSALRRYPNISVDRFADIAQKQLSEEYAEKFWERHPKSEKDRGRD